MQLEVTGSGVPYSNTNLELKSTEPKPEIVQKLTDVRVGEGAAYSAENVRIAQSDVFREEMKPDDVLNAIDDDKAKKEVASADLREKLAKKNEIIEEKVSLEDAKSRAESMVAEALRLLEEDGELIERAQRLLLEEQDKYRLQADKIDSERRVLLGVADAESIRRRSELKTEIHTRSEFVAGGGMKEDLKLIGKLTTVVGDPDLANALGRLQQEMGAVSGVVAGIEAMKTKAEKTGIQRMELAEAVRQETHRIEGDREAKQVEAEQKAVSEKALAEEELKKNSDVLKARIQLYENRLKEHTALRENNEKVVVESGSGIEEAEKKIEDLEEGMKKDEAEINSLDSVITAQNELVAGLAEALQRNSENLSIRGREIIELTTEAVRNIGISFEEYVESSLAIVEQRAQTDINEDNELFQERMGKIAGYKNDARKFAEETLVGTGLFEMEDGEISQKPVKGLDMVIAAREKTAIVDGALDYYQQEKANIDRVESNILKEHAEELEDINRSRGLGEKVINGNAEVERGKLAAALTSVEAIASVIPPQEAVAGGNEPQLPHPWYRTTFNSIGKLLGGLFGKRSS